MNIYTKYLKKYQWQFIIAISCVGCEAICDLLGPTLMSEIINNGVEKNSVSNVWFWGGWMLLVTFVGACFACVRNVLASRVSQKMGMDLRYDLFAKIMSFSEEAVDKIETGSLITRMTNDTTQVTQFVNSLMRIFFKAPITCIGSIVMATILNARLSLIIYGVVLCVGVLIYISMNLSYKRFALLQKAMDRVNVVTQEYLMGIRLVKAFGTYEEEEERFQQTNQNLMKQGVSTQMVVTLAAPLMTLTVGFGTILAIYFGGVLFQQGQTKPGDISAFTIYMAQILLSLMMMTNIFNVFVRTRTSAKRIGEVLEGETDFSEEGDISEIHGNIVVEDIVFTYPNGSGVSAIHHLSFEVEQGEHLAIIGPTGCGKSTLCWLLLRFYDVDQGRILIDGKDIKQYSVAALRNQIAIVPQKAMLFSGKVDENIRWGAQHAADALVTQAAKFAQGDFIEQMPYGFESPLGSGGVNISGGQKQRISIARAFIRNAPILILDDATSALDAITEAKIRASLKKDKAGQTILTVTQRCTTAMSADRILVMENGCAVGYGTHAALLESCKTYQEIYRSQIGNDDLG